MDKRERLNDVLQILLAVETLRYLDKNMLADLGGAACSRMYQEYLREAISLAK